KADWEACRSTQRGLARSSPWRRIRNPMAAMIRKGGRRTAAWRSRSRRRRQRQRRTDPGELLVEVDAEHFAARQPYEILREHRVGRVVGAEEHHADLDLHSA